MKVSDVVLLSNFLGGKGSTDVRSPVPVCPSCPVCDRKGVPLFTPAGPSGHPQVCVSCLRIGARLDMDIRLPEKR